MVKKVLIIIGILITALIVFSLFWKFVILPGIIRVDCWDNAVLQSRRLIKTEQISDVEELKKALELLKEAQELLYRDCLRIHRVNE